MKRSQHINKDEQYKLLTEQFKRLVEQSIYRLNKGKTHEDYNLEVEFNNARKDITDFVKLTFDKLPFEMAQKMFIEFDEKNPYLANWKDAFEIDYSAILLKRLEEFQSLKPVTVNQSILRMI